MRAIMLAAGMGRRLGMVNEGAPKCLLEFGGRSLLQRSLSILQACGIEEIVIGVGYRAGQIKQALAVVGAGNCVELQDNPGYAKGSILTLWALREQIARGGDVVLMDADMLFDCRLLERLVGSQHRNCLLLDRSVESNGEPVKLCIRGGFPAELRKKIDPDERYDLVGEMAGLVRLSAECANRLAARAQSYVDGGRLEEEYEEALRDVVLTSPESFGVEDCTGLPWIEIDSPQDVQRAREEILPRLQENSRAEGCCCSCV